MKYILIFITLVYFTEIAPTDLRIDVKEIHEQSDEIHISTSSANPGAKLEALDTRRDLRKKKRKPSKPLKTYLDTLVNNVRPLQEGDIFTPLELLPVAKKLLEKAKKFAYKFGLLAKNNKPEMLADKLFERFFQKKKRIVDIKDTDIDDLDSLQALALNGEAGADITTTDNPRNTLKEKKNKIPKSCKFSLLSKKTKRKPEVQKGVIHRVENLTKQPSKPACRWKYICEDPRDIDTCKLSTRCNKVVIPVFRASKQAVSIQQLMEILYGRSLKLKLNRNSTDIESLGEYFNNLLQREYDESKRNIHYLKKYNDISVTSTEESLEETYWR